MIMAPERSPGGLAARADAQNSHLGSRNDPASRLADLGAAALSVQELLSVIIDPRDTDGSAMAAALQLVGEFAHDDGTSALRALGQTSPRAVARRVGIRRSAAARLIAAVEIGRRAMEELVPTRMRFRSGADIHAYMRWSMQDLAQEECRAILLNSRGEAVRRVALTIGTVNTCLLTPVELFRAAIREAAPSVILVHNHPSGDPSPSPDDYSLTQAIAKAGEVVHVELADHVIIAGERWFSFRDAGMLG